MRPEMTIRPALAGKWHASTTRTTRSGRHEGRALRPAGRQVARPRPSAQFNEGACATRPAGRLRIGTAASQPMNCCKGANSPLNVNNVIPI